MRSHIRVHGRLRGNDGCSLAREPHLLSPSPEARWVVIHALALSLVLLAIVLAWAAWMVLIAAVDAVRQQRAYRKARW